MEFCNSAELYTGFAHVSSHFYVSVDHSYELLYHDAIKVVLWDPGFRVIYHWQNVDSGLHKTYSLTYLYWIVFCVFNCVQLYSIIFNCIQLDVGWANWNAFLWSSWQKNWSTVNSNWKESNLFKHFVWNILIFTQFEINEV